jgi:hypothetical protein
MDEQYQEVQPKPGKIVELAANVVISLETMEPVWNIPPEPEAA